MNHHLAEREFQVTFVRTVYSTVTVLAVDMEEAEGKAKTMARSSLWQEEIDVAEDENRQDWKVDSIHAVKFTHFKRQSKEA
jgi:hypothetical protein